MGEICNVAWNSYSDHVTSMLRELMASNEYTDVTLVCADKVVIQAHKIVLSACSQFFNNILKGTFEAKPIIYLKGIQSSEINYLLQFIYNGETSFPQDLTNSFINAANELEIKAFSNDNLCTKVDKDEPQPEVVEEYQGNQTNNMQQQDVNNIGESKSSDSIDIPKPRQKTSEPAHPARKMRADFPTNEENVGINHNYEIMSVSLEEEDQLNDNTVLKQHDSIRHEDKSKCEVCGFITSKTHKGEVPIMIHKITKHGHKLCSKCEHVTATQEELIEHELEDHDFKFIKNHKCEELLCSFSCDNKRFLKHHRRHHIRKNEAGSYKCDQCDFFSNNREVIKKHNDSNHENRKEKKLKGERRRKDDTHLGRKTPFFPLEVMERFTIKEKDQSKIYSCNECEYQNPKKINIKRHIESKHLGITYPCEQCGYLAQRMPILKEHIAAVHERSLRHKCKKCEKSFNHYNSMVIHEKSIHQGLTYPCQLCRSIFTRSSSLYKHTKKYH